ncbi:MAG TPA: MBL fold metallo-hydrolase [Opitutaceae bacterium]|nr:MBL fold metallo-hydrolase [Opitutaceae bacterium]
MEVIFLGTGTSQGVPMIACDCAVCRSPDPRNRRTRASVHVVMDGLHVQVDAAPEFRLQCLREDVRRLDFFVLTHGHADHVVGMDDLRRFCDLIGGEALTVYTTGEGMARVLAIFPYTIAERPVTRGYAAFKLVQMPPVLELPQGTIRSTLLPHGGINTLGLVFEEKSTGRRLAYYNDCKRVPREAVALAAGADLVVLDGLRVEPHATHMNIEEACAAAAEIRGRRTLLTHLTHGIDHATWSAQLPAGIELAYDGLRLTL